MSLRERGAVAFAGSRSGDCSLPWPVMTGQACRRKPVQSGTSIAPAWALLWWRAASNNISNAIANNSLQCSPAVAGAKLDFVILDQESVGGTVLQYPRHKVVMTRPVELPLYGKLKVTEVSKEALLEVWKEILARTGLQVRTGVRVDDVKRDPDGVFELKTSAGPIRARRVMLAMGRRGALQD